MHRCVIICFSAYKKIGIEMSYNNVYLINNCIDHKLWYVVDIWNDSHLKINLHGFNYPNHPYNEANDCNVFWKRIKRKRNSRRRPFHLPQKEQIESMPMKSMKKIKIKT